MRTKVLPLLFFIPLLWLSYLAFSSGLAQFLSYPAQQLLTTPTKNSIDLSGRESHEEALAYLMVAHRWSSDNSQLLEMSGDILLRLWQMESGKDIHRLQQAATNLRSAIVAEPGRASLWARLVSVKAALHEFDDEFYLAYHNATTLGQWDYRVNRMLVETGFVFWDYLPGKTRLTHKSIVRNFYQVAPMETIELAEKYNNLYMACIWVGDLHLIDGTCVQLLK